MEAIHEKTESRLTDEQLDFIQECLDKYLVNPSGIASCMYMKGMTNEKFGTLRALIINEIQRIKSNENNKNNAAYKSK